MSRQFEKEQGMTSKTERQDHVTLIKEHIRESGTTDNQGIQGVAPPGRTRGTLHTERHLSVPQGQV